MRRGLHTVRGISLIEAVVALAVMAFGMLAIVGLQSSLRFNGDMAKQRSQAVRIAQEAIEQWRAYSKVEADAGQTDYVDVVTTAGEAVAGENTSYTLVRTVVDAAVSPAAPRMKTLFADVSWQDRNGETQSVRLSTTIAASPPELAGSLSVPDAGGAPRLPRGRNPAIPVVAKDLGEGLSGFKPPGGAGATTVFVFNNATGVIVGVCNGVLTGQDLLTSADVQNCSNNANGLPLSGFVRFSTGMVQPAAAQAENPSSTALNLEVRLALTSVGHANPDHACFAAAPLSSETENTVVAYFCGIFFQPGILPLWSGMSSLTPLAFVETPEHPWRLADDAADIRVDRYRVCRYTPAVNDAQQIANQLHPRSYANVRADEPLTHQNFLVIRAGNGVDPAFRCPTDVPANPAADDFVNSNTLVHQPPPAAP